MDKKKYDEEIMVVFDNVVKELESKIIRNIKIGLSFDESQFRLLYDAILFNVFLENKTNIAKWLSGDKIRKPWKKKIKIRAYLIKKYLKTFTKGKKKIINAETVDVLSSEFYQNSSQVNLRLFKELRREYRVGFLAVRKSVSRCINPKDFDVFVDVESLYAGKLKDFINFRRDLNKVLHLNKNDKLYNVFQLLRGSIKENLSEAWIIKYKLDNLLASLDPKVFVTTGYHRIDSRLIWQYAQTRAIPTVFFQHGLMEFTPLGKHIKPTHAAVWGDHFLHMFSEGDKTQWFITGSSKHQKLLDQFGQYTPDNKSVLIIGTPPTGKYVDQLLYLKLVNFFIEIARDIKDHKFIYKPHPSESIDKVKEIFKTRNSPANLTVTDTNSYELLGKSKIVICITSTLAFEALLFKRDLILIDIGYRRLFPFHSQVPLVKIGDTNRLSDFIVNYKKQLPIEATEAYFATTNNSLQQSVNLVESLLN